MIHALQSRGVCDLLAVTVTKDHELAGPFVDAVNTFYGRPKIPIGVVRDLDDLKAMRQDHARMPMPAQGLTSTCRIRHASPHPNRADDGSESFHAQRGSP